MRYFQLLVLFGLCIPFGLTAQNNNQDSISWSIDLDQMVVTGQYAPTHSKNAIQAIRVINRQMIEERGVNNLEQLFQQDLSIRIDQDMVLGSNISMLGVGGENVKIMIDGIPVVGRLNGNIDLSQINLQNIERVEIIEGPLAVSYGSDALGGVINLISKKSQIAPLSMSIQQQLESRGENSTTAELGYRAKDWLFFRWSGGYDRFGGFSEDTTRSALWNPKEQWYTNALLSSNFGKDHKISYQFAYFNEEVENLGDIRRPVFRPYAFDDKFLTQRTDHTLTHEGSLSNSFYWQTNVGLNDYERVTQNYRIDFDPSGNNLLSSDTTAFNNFVFRSVLASKFANSNFNFQLGVDLERETGSGDRILDLNSENPAESQINETAIFGSLRYQNNSQFSLEAGLRLSEHSRYDVPFIPSLHFKYPLGEHFQIRGSYAKGFRSPSLKELFISFIDINHFIIGNPDLEAEQSDNLQFHFQYQKQFQEKQFQASAQVFYNNIYDKIELFSFVLDGAGNSIPDETASSGQFAYFNLEEAKIRGIQLKAAFSTSALEAEIGFSRIYQFNPISGSVEDVERYTPTSDLNARLSYFLPVVDTRVTLFGRFVDRLINYLPEEGNETLARQSIIDGYSLMDLMFNRNFLDKRLSITAGVRNLFNTQNSNIIGGGGGVHGGGNSFQISPGRSFMLSTKLSLQRENKMTKN